MCPQGRTLRYICRGHRKRGQARFTPLAYLCQLSTKYCLPLNVELDAGGARLPRATLQLAMLLMMDVLTLVPHPECFHRWK